MASRSLQSGDYVLLTSGGKSQTYIVKNVVPEGIYISPLTDPTQSVLLVGTTEGWKVQGSVVDYKIEFIGKENPPLIFTNVPDIDIQILNNLDNDTLNSACRTNAYAESLCQKDELWERRTAKYFPDKSAAKPTGMPWKNYYLTLSAEKGNIYIAMEISWFDRETNKIGIYHTKRSAAEGIFKYYIKNYGLTAIGTERYSTELGDITEDEFIRRLMHNNEMLMGNEPPSYYIFQHSEGDIKP